MSFPSSLFLSHSLSFSLFLFSLIHFPSLSITIPLNLSFPLNPFRPSLFQFLSLLISLPHYLSPLIFSLSHSISFSLPFFPTYFSPISITLPLNLSPSPESFLSLPSSTFSYFLTLPLPFSLLIAFHISWCPSHLLMHFISLDALTFFNKARVWYSRPGLRTDSFKFIFFITLFHLGLHSLF